MGTRDTSEASEITAALAQMVQEELYPTAHAPTHIYWGPNIRALYGVHKQCPRGAWDENWYCEVCAIMTTPGAW